MSTRVLLVSCGAAKLKVPAPAQDLYVGSLTRAAIGHAQASGGPWYIVSARYGLLRPERVIEPYNLSVLDMGPNQRREWGSRVAHELRGVHPELVEVEVHMGEGYLRHLRPWFPWDITAPLAGLEIGVTDDGRFVSVPRFYSEVFITDTFQASPTDALDAVHGMEAALDSKESATAVLVYGTNNFGARHYGFAVDTFAERAPASGRFCPWRECIQEEIPGTSTVAMCIARAQALAQEFFGLRVESSLEVPCRPDIARRSRIQVPGTKLGLTDYDEEIVLGITHHFLPAPSDCRTILGLRRLG